MLIANSARASFIHVVHKGGQINYIYICSPIKYNLTSKNEICLVMIKLSNPRKSISISESGQEGGQGET